MCTTTKSLSTFKEILNSVPIIIQFHTYICIFFSPISLLTPFDVNNSWSYFILFYCGTVIMSSSINVSAAKVSVAVQELWAKDERNRLKPGEDVWIYELFYLFDCLLLLNCLSFLTLHFHQYIINLPEPQESKYYMLSINQPIYWWDVF